jgi:hypothetical protein
MIKMRGTLTVNSLNRQFGRRDRAIRGGTTRIGTFEIISIEDQKFLTFIFNIFKARVFCRV